MILMVSFSLKDIVGLLLFSSMISSVSSDWLIVNIFHCYFFISRIWIGSIRVLKKVSE